MTDADDDGDEIMSVEEFASYSDDDDFVQEPREDYTPPVREYLADGQGCFGGSGGGGGSSSVAYLMPPRPQSADSSMTRLSRQSTFNAGISSKLLPLQNILEDSPLEAFDSHGVPEGAGPKAAASAAELPPAADARPSAAAPTAAIKTGPEGDVSLDLFHIPPLPVPLETPTPPAGLADPSCQRDADPPSALSPTAGARRHPQSQTARPTDGLNDDDDDEGLEGECEDLMQDDSPPPTSLGSPHSQPTSPMPPHAANIDLGVSADAGFSAAAGGGGPVRVVPEEGLREQQQPMLPWQQAAGPDGGPDLFGAHTSGLDPMFALGSTVVPPEAASPEGGGGSGSLATPNASWVTHSPPPSTHEQLAQRQQQQEQQQQQSEQQQQQRRQQQDVGDTTDHGTLLHPHAAAMQVLETDLQAQAAAMR
ncbi:MAG: hypothetical protein WDW36_007531 [Sanguina aurantia]